MNEYEDYETGAFEPNAEQLRCAYMEQIPDKPWWKFWEKQRRVTWIYTKLGDKIQLTTGEGTLTGTGWPFVAATFTPIPGDGTVTFWTEGSDVGVKHRNGVPFWATVITTLILAGCATSPDEIGAEYVPASKYLHLTCDQINSNLATAEAQANKMYDQLQSDRSKDETTMVISMLLFWPALFFIDGDSPDVQTYAQLQGEVLALTQASEQNNC